MSTVNYAAHLGDGENPGARLVSAFGYPEKIAVLLADEVEWTLPDSLDLFSGTTKSKAKVIEMMQTIFGEIYLPESMTIDVLEAISQENTVAVRFRLRAHTTLGPEYDNQYALFGQLENGKFVRVWEYLDSQSATKQLGG